MTIGRDWAGYPLGVLLIRQETTGWIQRRAGASFPCSRGTSRNASGNDVVAASWRTCRFSSALSGSPHLAGGQPFGMPLEDAGLHAFPRGLYFSVFSGTAGGNALRLSLYPSRLDAELTACFMRSWRRSSFERQSRSGTAGHERLRFSAGARSWFALGIRRQSRERTLRHVNRSTHSPDS